MESEGRTLPVVVLLMCSPLTAAACEPVAPELDADPGTPRALQLNTPQLNTATLNGFTLNGITLNGFTLNGITLTALTLDGLPLSDAVVDGSTLTATVDEGGDALELSGAALIGAHLELEREGHPYRLIIDDVYPNPADPDGDVLFYELTVVDEISETASPLCEVDGEAKAAIFLANYWDLETGDRIDNPSAVTIACRGGAIAKCVEWGYRPWATAVECDDERCFEISLTDHHQACTRMARADYCGDGTPHTENGTLIDIYDDLSPPIASAEAAGHHSWGVEAEWGPAGATCVGKSLRLDILDSSTQVPSCLKDLKDLEACGSFDASRPESRLANYFCTKFDFKPELCD